MEEDDRRNLYMALLRGLANEAQDRLCATDKQHAWGPWRQFRVRHDEDRLPRYDPSATMCDCVVIVRAERRCENCGKEQTA